MPVAHLFIAVLDPSMHCAPQQNLSRDIFAMDHVRVR